MRETQSTTGYTQKRPAVESMIRYVNGFTLSQPHYAHIYADRNVKRSQARTFDDYRSTNVQSANRKSASGTNTHPFGYNTNDQAEHRHHTISIHTAAFTAVGAHVLQATATQSAVGHQTLAVR